MKKYLTIIFLVSLSALSCDKTNVEVDSAINACGVTSFDELTWAQALITGKGPCELIYKGATITMYDYNNEKVFYFENPASSLGVCTRAVYNCSGAIIIPAMAEAKVWGDFETKRKNKRLLWQKI
ncbi:MAG TPA: hypothetical protein VEV16_10565 [Daejeonella sp.]|nr:hypothetical protein [Daejeonella sp.]